MTLDLYACCNDLSEIPKINCLFNTIKSGEVTFIVHNVFTLNHARANYLRKVNSFEGSLKRIQLISLNLIPQSAFISLAKKVAIMPAIVRFLYL